MGVHGRLVVCPNCRSFDRERAVFLFLKRHTNLFSGTRLRVLHFAPEKNLRAQIAAQGYINYVTADLDERKADQKQDITKLSFPSCSFDVIICVHVLEHVQDDASAMRELLRVLVPGGWALILVPIKEGLESTIEDPNVTDPQDRLRLFGQSDHVRQYGADFAQRLRHEGFVVSMIPFDAIFTKTEYTKYRLLCRGDMYLARKVETVFSRLGRFWSGIRLQLRRERFIPMFSEESSKLLKALLDKMLSPFNVVIRRASTLRALQSELQSCKAQLDICNKFVPPGHFYSPIPHLATLKQREHVVWRKSCNPLEMGGIEWNTEDQLKLFDSFVPFYSELPFPREKQPGLRYHYNNRNYSYSDAIFLYCFIRYLRPKHIIEIGSGYSSCVILDTNELFLKGTAEVTFIEPYPKLLLSLISSDDGAATTLLQKQLQDVDPSLFSNLEAGDIVFVDSSHVSKVGSDVNWFFFELLPRIPPGVYVHFHDIFWNFEYPREWTYQGRIWNEAYILRAFLQYNDRWKIAFCNTYLETFFRNLFIQKMPLCLENEGGSIWLTQPIPVEDTCTLEHGCSPKK